jgi:CxxC motif-containing protein (DUF1111 family)
MFERNRNTLRWVPCLLAILALTFTLNAGMQQDPGLRAGVPGAGGALPGLTTKESKFFVAGLDEFQEVQSVTGTIPGTEAGLGPRFNLDSCSGCHSQPAIGGSSPETNPQVAVANKNGATNVVPSFISTVGPVREVRFKYSDPLTMNTRDGGVHGLFTITGRTDAVGCNISQPDFVTAVNQNNVVFRIPTPLFGMGLIEAIPDSAILQNKAANAAAKGSLGISGHENREGNAGTIMRFGWKAQNKSLLIFAGEAYNVEQGVSNELFQQEREEAPGCRFNPTPEDHTNYEDTQPQQISSNAVSFANYMLFLAPPSTVSTYNSSVPVPHSVSAASINNGRTLFNSNSLGCALCHTPSLTTGTGASTALSNQVANLFSDLLVHRMGNGLKDDIIQGSAGPDEFRTAPLWGLGQRIFFLHDGRANDLSQAITAHEGVGSEANGSIAAFNLLSSAQKQDLLNFLRSL